MNNTTIESATAEIEARLEVDPQPAPVEHRKRIMMPIQPDIILSARSGNGIRLWM